MAFAAALVPWPDRIFTELIGLSPPAPYTGAMATRTEDLQIATPVISLTPEAYKVVKEAIANEPDPGSLALGLEVGGVQGGSFVYDLYFQAVPDADEGDVRHSQEELEIVIPAA